MKKNSETGIPLNNRTDIDRRTMLKSTVLAMGAGASIPSLIAAENTSATKPSIENEGPAVIARACAAVVEIESGKIAGAVIRRIYSFKGIPYGATTAGENRFRPAQKLKPWTGDPNHTGIPHWPKFTPKTVPTMMYDNEVKAELNPDALEIESIA